MFPGIVWIEALCVTSGPKLVWLLLTKFNFAVSLSRGLPIIVLRVVFSRIIIFEPQSVQFSTTISIVFKEVKIPLIDKKVFIIFPTVR